MQASMNRPQPKTPAQKRKATIQRQKRAALKAAIAARSPQPMTRQYTNVGLPGFKQRKMR